MPKQKINMVDSMPSFASGSEPTTFPLPLELRRQIWELCFFHDEPTMFSYSPTMFKYEPAGPEGWIVTQKSYPVTMQINCESRDWTLSLVREKEAYTIGERKRLFNPAIDTFFLPDIDIISFKLRRDLVHELVTAGVQHLAVAMLSSATDWIYDSHKPHKRWLLHHVLARFTPALRTVAVVVTHSPYYFDSPPSTHTTKPHVLRRWSAPALAPALAPGLSAGEAAAPGGRFAMPPFALCAARPAGAHGVPAADFALWVRPHAARVEAELQRLRKWSADTHARPVAFHTARMLVRGTPAVMLATGWKEMVDGPGG